MIEIDVVRKISDAIAASQALANRRKQIRVGPNLQMAAHARVRRWHALRWGAISTVLWQKAAIDPKPGNMMLVAEGGKR